MSLGTGTRLGPYELISVIGAGGMGEVYRARDTRLDRTVAVKILPEHLSANADLKQRFEREARTISSLSHPNICSLYDIGHQDGIDFLVMEFLEGETLAERLSKGALPMDQVLRYGMQIADALDKAHKQGIVHRDLKPGNIMITKSGIKLLDFGLAKLQAPVQEVISEVSSLPTRQRDLTAEGTIIGTLQYMSPEQLEGREADARTDLFALGLILYEIATGRKAFTGKSQASLIAAILSSEPKPISAIQPLSPPAFDRLVKNCLAKDPEDRWQTAHDVMLELRWIAEGGSQAGIPSPVTSHRRHREWLAWLLAGLFFIALAGVTFLYFSKPKEETNPLRVSVLSPEVGNLWHSSISPDGLTLAIVAFDPSARTHLWIRSLANNTATQLPETEGAAWPFWSPDGSYIGFFADDSLKKIQIPNGRPEVICDAEQNAGGTWGKNGTILFTNKDVIYRVNSSGGVPQPVTKLDANHEGHRWPVFLPDGDHFLYLDDSGKTEFHFLQLASLNSGKTQKILSPFFSDVAHARGYIFFVRSGTLMAQRLDPKKFQLTGSPVAVTDQIREVFANHRFDFSVSENGTIAYRQQNPSSQLIWFDRSGLKMESVGEQGRYASLDLSPDNSKVAVEVLDSEGRNGEIWVVQFSRGISTRFTFDPGADLSPIWSPDGTKIVFGSNRKGRFLDLFQKTTNQATDELLKGVNADAFPVSWTPDGKFVIYASNDQRTKADLWLLPISGNQKPIPLIRSEFNEDRADVSADGNWIAYSSDESGRSEIYVQTMPPSGARYQISNDGGSEPQWRQDGKEIFFISPDKQLMAAQILRKDPFETSIPKALFVIQERFIGPERGTYAVSNDGNRFLINTVSENSMSNAVHLITNWTPKQDQ